MFLLGCVFVPPQVRHRFVVSFYFRTSFVTLFKNVPIFENTLNIGKNSLDKHHLMMFMHKITLQHLEKSYVTVSLHIYLYLCKS